MKKNIIIFNRITRLNFLLTLIIGIFLTTLIPTKGHAETTFPLTETDSAVEPSNAVVSGEDDRELSFGEIVSESLFGDVYAEPSKWQDLSYGNFFSKGWDKPWASPPNGYGGNGAPRQGWLNANEGVFYRLGIATFGWNHGSNAGFFGNNNIDNYNGGLTLFTPLNQRFEIQTDIPFAASTQGSFGGRFTNFGDLQITPRFILSESKDVTQSFNLTFRTPTGESVNGNSVAAINPNCQFWTNWWKGLVVRGGVGFFVPYAGDILASGTRSTFNANVAVGYYFTPHNFTPIGDMVWYVSANLAKTIDNRGPDKTFVSLTPGFRTHVGDNWYLLGAVEVPVTNSLTDYQVLGGIMKVF